MKDNNASSGNVLFLILIAVVLFAALSYAVTQSSRGGGNADSETTQLKIAEMMNYVTAIRTAVMRMKINGVADESLCFDADQWGHTDYNFAACSDNDNRVFHPDGGGVSWREPPAGINDGTPWEFAGNVVVEYWSGTFTGEPELAMFLPNIPLDVCRAMNNYLEIDYSGADVPNGLNSLGITRFTGTYNDTDGIGNAATADPSLWDQKDFCFEEIGTGDYFFVSVLLDRD